MQTVRRLRWLRLRRCRPRREGAATESLEHSSCLCGPALSYRAGSLERQAGASCRHAVAVRSRVETARAFRLRVAKQRNSGLQVGRRPYHQNPRRSRPQHQRARGTASVPHVTDTNSPSDIVRRPPVEKGGKSACEYATGKETRKEPGVSDHAPLNELEPVRRAVCAFAGCSTSRCHGAADDRACHRHGQQHDIPQPNERQLQRGARQARR